LISGRLVIHVFLHEPGHPGGAAAGRRLQRSLIHAPNEHIRLEDARSAIKAFAALMLLWS